MGWANCGSDSKGRPIGYAHAARCDHPGCKARIDRGLAYACGGMHGSGDLYCEGYFCTDHLKDAPDNEGGYFSLCPACYAAYEKLARESPQDFRQMAEDMGLVEPAEPATTD